jgi:hypothetical protein
LTGIAGQIIPPGTPAIFEDVGDRAKPGHGNYRFYPLEFLADQCYFHKY